MKKKSCCKNKAICTTKYNYTLQLIHTIVIVKQVSDLITVTNCTRQFFSLNQIWIAFKERNGLYDIDIMKRIWLLCILTDGNNLITLEVDQEQSQSPQWDDAMLETCGCDGQQMPSNTTPGQPEASSN